MTICQICGDEGYLKLLTHCVQCESVAAHRYCVLNPSIFEETIKWLCEFCDPGKIKPTTPSRKSQDLNSTEQQTVLRKTAQTKLGNNLCLPESEKPNNGQKEIPKETTDTFILDQNNEDNSSKRKQVKQSDDVKKGEINYDSGIQKESCQAVQVKEQSVTNVSQADTNGHPQANLGKIKPTTPSRKSQDLNSTVQQTVLRKTAQTKLGNNLCIPESEKPNIGQKEISKETIDISILDQNKEDNSSKRKHVKRSDDVKKGEINYDSGIQKESCQAVQVKEQSVTNVSQVDTNGHPQANLGSIVCALLAKVEDDIIGGTKLVKRQNITWSLLPNKGDGASSLDKSSCEVYSKPMELHINESQPDAELAYPAEDKKSEVEETIADFVKRKQVKRLVGVKKIKQANDDNGVKKSSFEADQVNKQCTKNVRLSDTNGHRQVNVGKKLKKIKQSNYDNGVKKGSFDADQIKEQSVKNVSMSDSDGHRQVNLGKNLKKIKPNYDNGVKKGSFEADQVKEQSVKNVSLSDTNGHRQVNLGKSVGPLLTKGNDSAVTESTCKAGHCIQGGTKSLEQKKPTSGLGPKKGDGAFSLDKSSCQVSSKQTKVVHMNESQPDAEEADYANKKKSELEEITAEFVVDRQPPRKKRKFIIEMEYSDEDPVFVVTKHSQLVAHVGEDHLMSKSTSEALSKLSDDGLAQLSSIESVPLRSSPMKADERGLTLESSVVFDNRIPAQTLYLAHYVSAQPLNEVAWRGCCNIDDEHPMSLVLEAHLSNKAHENVRGAVCDLPMSLEFCLVSKKNAWPKTFESSPPTADVIGLYFFPIDERSENLYDYLVDKMIEHSLVLKVLLKYVELLVFCSIELPQEERTMRRKYYLWGVFKPRKDFAIPYNQQEDPSTLTSPAYRSTRSFSETHFCQEAFAESAESTLPIAKSPYQAHDMQGQDIHNSSLRTVSYTHFRQEVEVEPVELTRPYFERLYESHDKQGHGIHDGDTRISQKPQNQDREHQNRTEYVKYSERSHKYRKNDDRWNRESRKSKDRGWRSSRYRSNRSYDRSRSNYR